MDFFSMVRNAGGDAARKLAQSQGQQSAPTSEGLMVVLSKFAGTAQVGSKMGTVPCMASKSVNKKILQ